MNPQLQDLLHQITTSINAEFKEHEQRIAELQAKIDEMAGDIMSLENRIGTMTGYGHN